ncbi:Sterol-regulatory element binding proteins intramembrane protease [Gossypium australe]|uniref:Sterol-regulatory element binding proteins intramembrane protease n=1 Tax=Gossypium australe TaxID=47621 RepID=A0A5B6VWZ4_9ROSI|nr:Sterol-regulatory element binding proteins intramembrane protease [Gossypium australe]
MGGFYFIPSGTSGGQNFQEPENLMSSQFHAWERDHLSSFSLSQVERDPGWGAFHEAATSGSDPGCSFRQRLGSERPPSQSRSFVVNNEGLVLPVEVKISVRGAKDSRGAFSAGCEIRRKVGDHGRLQMPDWPRYALSLRERFGSSMFANPMTKLVTLKQQGSLEHFHDLFIGQEHFEYFPKEEVLGCSNSMTRFGSLTPPIAVPSRLVSLPQHGVHTIVIIGSSNGSMYLEGLLSESTQL